MNQAENFFQRLTWVGGDKIKSVRWGLGVQMNHTDQFLGVGVPMGAHAAGLPDPSRSPLLAAPY
jgi:hypothetical protein